MAMIASTLKRLAAFALATLAATVAAAQSPADLAAATGRLNQTAAEIRTVDKALDERVDGTRRRELRDQAAAARASANDTAASLAGQIALVDARIAELGPVAAGAAEAPDIRAQRTLLAQQRNALDSAAKRGRLLVVEAQQLTDEIEASQAEQFNQRIATRVPSPVSPAFWTSLAHATPRDLRRVSQLAGEGTAAVRSGLRGGQPWLALLGLLLAAVLFLPVRLFLRDRGRRYLLRGETHRRVRRSGYALWRLAVGTLLPGLAMAALAQGLRWSGLVSPRWDQLLAAAGPAVVVSAFVAALAGALLMRHESGWRLLPLDDDTAQRVRPWTWLLSALAFATQMLNAFNAVANASVAARTAAEVVEAVLHVLLIGGVLVTIGRLRANRATGDDAEELAVHAGVAVATLVAWGVVIAAVGALLVGFVGFSLFLSQMTAWTTIVVSATYLALVATDDLASSLFAGDTRIGQMLHRGLGLRRSAIDQFGVLLSGALRVLLTLVGIGFLLSPFGSGVGSLFDRLGVVAQGITIGGVSIAPNAIFRAVVVLTIGMALVRLFGRWLTGSYLPTTELDGSARNSVSLVARYIGILLAGLWALASLGIGVERIALLLSALSVGIGFGLQAITQNFVSGLILLAERPVKIGDLVRIGADEGDVKRISVRSTEIELADHSTLIVPNSELITKTVLNKTLASPLGRIQLQFSVPLGADPGRVRDLVLATFAAEPAVLVDPAPAAFVDGIADGRILFNCFAHVENPRAAYGARSAVLIDLLQRLGHEGIDIGTVAQRLELATPVPTLPIGTGAEDGGARKS